MKITDFVTDSNKAHFSRYRAGNLYYRVIKVKGDEAGDVYEFPVPTEDLMGATVHNEERSLTMMRYIRTALSEGTLLRVKVDAGYY